MTQSLLDALAHARLLIEGARVDLTQRPVALDVLDALDGAVSTLRSGTSGENEGGRAALLAREREARLSAERSQRQMAFMYEATRVLFGSPLEVDSRLTKVAGLTVPDLADWCFVARRDGEERVRRVAVRTWNPEMIERARAYETTVDLDPSAGFGVDCVLRTGKPEMCEVRAPRVGRGPGEIDFERILDDIGAKSYLVVPLTFGAATVGTIALVFSESNRRYSDGDLVVAADLASRAAFAVDNARLFETLEQAMRTREEMVGVVSHDLRGPLSAIRMSAELIKLAPDKSYEKKVDVILRQSIRMERLIADLLEVTTIEAGGLALQRERWAPDAVAADAIELARPMAEAKSLRLSLRSTLGMGTLLSLDRERLLQVLSNLLGNAIKYTGSGGAVTVALREDKAAVLVDVADTGVGIPPEDVVHVFDRFWQGQRARSSSHPGLGGAGLGLSIARGIVEAHGGKLSVASVVGEGTTFTFSLPRG